MLPEYKAQRPEMPDDLKPQLDEIVKLFEGGGRRVVLPRGVEADDYIACLARRAADAGMAVVIASADKDFMQLVSPRVGLLNPNDKSEAVWTDEQVRAKTGVEPSQIVDWLSLMGDSVDNIPGVPGVGPKTAAGFVEPVRFGRGIVRRLDEVKSEKLRAALRDSAARCGATANWCGCRTICRANFRRRTGGKTGGCRAAARIVPALGIQGNARGAGRPAHGRQAVLI
jgi:DNA polymerase I